MIIARHAGPITHLAPELVWNGKDNTVVLLSGDHEALVALMVVGMSLCCHCDRVEAGSPKPAMKYFLEAIKEDPSMKGDMQLISVCKHANAKKQMQLLWLAHVQLQTQLF